MSAILFVTRMISIPSQSARLSRYADTQGAYVAAIEMFNRETPSCRKCDSTVRYRSLIHNLSLALFQTSIVLPEFPRRREIKGVGMSDWDGFAPLLAKKLDYTRTYFDREPRLDIKNLTDT